MSRWRLDREDDSGGRARFKVRDTQDPYGPPVAEFASEQDARAHIDHLEGGPFDWDEQEAWQDPDDEDDEDEGRTGWV